MRYRVWERIVGQGDANKQYLGEFEAAGEEEAKLAAARSVEWADNYEPTEAEIVGLTEWYHVQRAPRYSRDDISTHWDGCWKSHLGCALVRIEEMDNFITKAREDLKQLGEQYDAVSEAVVMLAEKYKDLSRDLNNATT